MIQGTFAYRTLKQRVSIGLRLDLDWIRKQTGKQ